MIEKERLEELIEQGATIWHDDYGEITLNEDCEICEVRSMSGVHLNWVFCFEYEYNNRKQWAELDIVELEEDVEVGKWKYEYHTTRPLEFRPCSYEQMVQTSINYCYTYDFVDNFLIQCQIYVDFEENYICINRGAFTPFVIEDVTKENYTKAVEMAYKLFKGEE